MTAASNSDARKREAEKTQQAASNSESGLSRPQGSDRGTDVVEDPNGAQIANLADALAAHRHPGEVLHIFGEAWMICSCGGRIDIPVVDSKFSPAEAARLFEAHQVVALAAIVREHRAQVLAEVRKLVDDAQRWIDMAAKAPSVSGDVAAFVHVQLVRDLRVALDRKEQNHA